MKQQKLERSNSKNIKWKYFFAGEDGELHITTNESEVPQDKNKVALLTTSMWFGSKDFTPEKMRNIVHSSLFHQGRNSNFCWAIPYEEGRGQQYYKNLKPQFSEYQDLVMHDFYDETASVPSGMMSAQNGADQIASAIEKGYDIFSIAGGGRLNDKIPLVQNYFLDNYFLDNPLPENHRKPLFFGFSDGSSMNFIPDIVNFYSTLGASILFTGGMPYRKANPDTIAQIIKTLERGNEDQVKRTFDGCSDIGEVKARYETALDKGYKIKHLTYFPYQLSANMRSPYCVQFSPDEKLIVSIEGYLQSSSGHNVSEVLFEAFSHGIFKKEQILCIAIENFVAKPEEMKLKRINGRLIYEQMDEPDKKDIIAILKQYNPDLQLVDEKQAIKDYITRSNAAYENEVIRVKAVCDHFKVPYIFGGQVRAGHATNFAAQPSFTGSLEFDPSQNSFTEISTSRDNKEIEVLNKRYIENSGEINYWDVYKEITSSCPYNQEYEILVYPPRECNLENEDYIKNPPILEFNPQTLQGSKMLALNSEATNFYHENKDGEKQIIGGNVKNVADAINVEENQGIVCAIPNHTSFRNTASLEALMMMIRSQKIGQSIINPKAQNPQFIILATQNEASEFEQKALKKYLTIFDITTPVFLMSNNTIGKSAGLFQGRLKLNEIPCTTHAEISSPRSSTLNLSTTQRQDRG